MGLLDGTAEVIGLADAAILAGAFFWLSDFFTQSEGTYRCALIDVVSLRPRFYR